MSCEIREKLMELYKHRSEDLLRLLFYLDEEDRIYEKSDSTPPAWKTLHSAAKVSENIFKNYADRLIEDTKTAEKDPSFRSKMNIVYQQMMDANDQPFDGDFHQEWHLLNLENLEMESVSALGGFSRAWGLLSNTTRAEMLELLPRIVQNKQLMSSLDELTGLINKTGGTVVMIGLAAISLSYDVIKNLKDWWKGDISGKRCAKNIVDSLATLGLGIGGGIGGAAAGAIAGPAGIVIGGVIGGLGCSYIAGRLSDILTQKIFGIPKDKTLENAYNFFGVQMSATNDEVNRNFRRLCLQHHPDKGGRAEDFIEVQINMGVIKLARGEMF